VATAGWWLEHLGTVGCAGSGSAGALILTMICNLQGTKHLFVPILQQNSDIHDY
jgi:hypothetical protein